MGIYLPLALVYIRVHVCNVAHPLPTCRAVIESVCIRVNVNELELPVDDTCNHTAQGLVIIRELDIRPYLCTGIPEPHRVYVPGINERIVHPVLLISPEVHCGVKCIRETVSEHPCKPRIGKHTLDLKDFRLDSLGAEKPVLLRRPLRFVLLRRKAQCPGDPGAKKR